MTWKLDTQMFITMRAGTKDLRVPALFFIDRMGKQR